MGRPGESSRPALEALPAAAPHFCAAPQFSGFLGISPVCYSLLSQPLGSVWGLGLKECSSFFCACLTQAPSLGPLPLGRCSCLRV